MFVPECKRPYIWKLVLFAAVLLMQRPIFGQDFVDAPEPKSASSTSAGSPFIQPRVRRTHEFFDHRNIIAFSAAAALRAADSGYTCAVGVGTTRRNSDGTITTVRETMLPVNSCHGVVLMNGAFTGMSLGGSYLLHKMGWHKLERLPNWITASVPAYAIAYTATHQR